jgi:hypothetical protein
MALDSCRVRLDVAVAESALSKEKQTSAALPSGNSRIQEPTSPLPYSVYTRM